MWVIGVLLAKQQMGGSSKTHTQIGSQAWFPLGTIFCSWDTISNFIYILYINLIGVLAIEEWHRQASLWAQPSIPDADVTKNQTAITPNLETVPSPQPQISIAESSVSNPHQTVETNSTAVTSPQCATDVACTQIQPMTVIPPIASSQCQETTVNTLFMGSQYPATNLHQTGEIILTAVMSQTESCLYQTCQWQDFWNYHPQTYIPGLETMAHLRHLIQIYLISLQ